MTTKDALNTLSKSRKRRHDLFLTQHVKDLPALGTTDGTPAGEHVCHLKLFGSGRWTWYAFEANAQYEDGTSVPLTDADPEKIEDVMFFGYCVSGLGEDCDELCYFPLSELTSCDFPPFGLPIERDMHFESKPLNEELRQRWGYSL